jgi:glycosyltransferase involved in cell wall biosynthesis
METANPTAPETPAVRVSVIVVSQNQVDLLRPTLEALSRRARPESSEVIVVDCGSRDGSSRLDEEFENMTFLRLPRNFGWTKAVNIGTRTAKGEYLLLLPNGVAVGPDTITEMADALESDPSAGAVTPAGELYALPKPGDSALSPASTDSAEYPHQQPVLFPRLSLVSMNYFRDAYGQSYADLELFHKLKDAGKKLKVLSHLRLDRQTRPLDCIDAETLRADELHGLSTYYGKQYGTGSSISFWFGQMLSSLFGFRLGLFGKLLGGAKVDGL